MKFDAVALLAVKFSRDKSRWRTIETAYDDSYIYLLYPCRVASLIDVLSKLLSRDGQSRFIFFLFNDDMIRNYIALPR